MHGGQTNREKLKKVIKDRGNREEGFDELSIVDRGVGFLNVCATYVIVSTVEVAEKFQKGWGMVSRGVGRTLKGPFDNKIAPHSCGGFGDEVVGAPGCLEKLSIKGEREFKLDDYATFIELLFNTVRFNLLFFLIFSVLSFIAIRLIFLVNEFYPWGDERGKNITNKAERLKWQKRPQSTVLGLCVFTALSLAGAMLHVSLLMYTLVEIKLALAAPVGVAAGGYFFAYSVLRRYLLSRVKRALAAKRGGVFDVFLVIAALGSFYQWSCILLYGIIVLYNVVCLLRYLWNSAKKTTSGRRLLCVFISLFLLLLIPPFILFLTAMLSLRFV